MRTVPSYDRSEVTTTTVEYRLRSPSPVGAVYRAIEAAMVELGHLPGDPLPSDDVLMVQTSDEEIVISFTYHNNKKVVCLG